MGPHGLRRTDFAVMAVFWGLDIFVPWVNTWGEFTFKTTFNKYAESTAYTINTILMVVVKCIVCLALAVNADLRNRKFFTYFISLIVYAATPAFAIITVVSSFAPFGFALPWLAATYFATTPLRFCSIFNQKPRALPDHTRLVVAFFDFAIGVSDYLLAETREELSEFPKTFITVVWIIKMPIFVLIITLTESIKQHLNKEVVTEPTLKAVIGGIKKDMKSVHGKKYIRQFILFMILLQPILVITFIDKVLETVDFETTVHVDQKRIYKKFEYLAQMVFLPLICVFLSFGKGIIGRFGDLVVIAIAHAFNTMICVLLYLYLRDKELADEVAVASLYGAPGEPGHASILIINGTEHQFFVKTPFYDTTQAVGILYLDIYLPTGSRTFDLTGALVGSPAMNTTVEVARNKRYRFLTIGTEKEIKKLIQVFGDDDSKMREGASVLLVMNGIVGETVNGIDVPGDSTDHVIQIDQPGRSGIRMALPPSHRLLKIIVPAGVAKCSYACQGDNESCYAFHPSKIRVRMEPYTEVTWVITNDGHTRMNLYTTLQLSPEEQKKVEKVLTSSYSLAGLAQSATAVGYIQFFWTESPIRLRTTLYAIFIVSNELVKYMVFYLVTSVSADIALGCVGLSCFGFFAHVIIGLFYDLRFRREIWLYLDEVRKEEEAFNQSTPQEPIK